MFVWAWVVWVNTYDIRLWMNIHWIHRPEDRCRPGPGGKLRWEGATKQWLEKSTKMVINGTFSYFWRDYYHLF